MSNAAKVVSMYSFKGGAGRTLCTANLAGIFAREVGATPESPILLIDMDLESAGLTLLLEQEKRYEGSPCGTNKLVTGELDLRITEQHRAFFAEGITDVSDAVGARPGTVRFLGTEVIGREAGVTAHGYALTWVKRMIRDCWAEGYSTVIIDSASGRQEAAHLCHLLSDVIVYCCRLTHQFLTGTESHLRSFISKCSELRDEGNQPSIILLPVAVPKLTSKRWEGRKNFALGRLTSMCNIGANVRLADSVGEVESFKWMESILAANGSEEGLAEDERQALGAYTSLARSIVKVIG